MRRAAKADIAQPAIFRALRDMGATVADTHALGQGFPDCAVGFRGQTFLLEIKTGERECDRKLTEDEADFHSKWGGHVCIVSTPDEAVDAVLRGCGLLPAAGRERK